MFRYFKFFKFLSSGQLGSKFCLAHIEDHSILGGSIEGNFSLNLFSNELQLIVYKKKFEML